jgi:hypothetical protein
MTDVINIIAEVLDKRYDERHEHPWGIMVHRCGVDLQTGVVLGYCAKDVCDAFLGRVPEWAEVARATGSQLAYSIMIGGDLGPAEFDGVAWQCLPLNETGWHGRRFSAGFIGVGLIADPRERAISQRQHRALVEVCATLCDGYDWDPRKRIYGHGDVEGSHDGSKAPGKFAACPGDLLSLRIARNDTAELIAHHRRARLAQQMQFSR